MRVLSIPQPFAQLVVRGIKRLEVRPWGSDFRGRIAIHASSAVPPKSIMKEWRTNREMALRFADQGWVDREDLKALPRSAIVGTVQLAGVHLGQELKGSGLLTWSWATERMEVATRDPRTGELRPIESKRKALSVQLLRDQYAWVFIEPVEINPITGVDGAQRLWNLVGELEGVIEDRELGSRRGWWRPPAVDPARRAKGIRNWRKVWESQREKLVRDVERRVLIRREIARTRFTPEVEEQMHGDLKRYIRRHRVEKHDGHGDHVRVEDQFRQMVGERDVVSAEEFELMLRRKLKNQRDDSYRARRGERRREELLELLTHLEKGAGRSAADRDNIRVRLEVAAERSIEEEEEDYEFVRRELYPVGKEKAERATERMLERKAEERREKRRREEQEQAVWEARVIIEVLEKMWGLRDDED